MLGLSEDSIAAKTEARTASGREAVESEVHVNGNAAKLNGNDPANAIALPGGQSALRRRPPVERRKKTRYPEYFKRALDILGATALTIVFSPIIVSVIILISFSGRPIFFSQERLGRHGKPFSCLKFRTMVKNADEVLEKLLESDPRARLEWLHFHKLKDDPRITRVGRFLRRTSLDELPQLWNVFRGDMSLVGPRPIVGDEIFRYGTKVQHYFHVKPGITGLWQVSGRNHTTYPRRVALDVFYVRRKSFMLDAWILLRTVGVVLRGSGAY